MPEATGSSEFEFRDYLDVIRRRGWVVVLAMVVVVGTALTLSYRKVETYRASGVLVVDTAGSGSNPLATEILVMESDAVRQLAKKTMPNIGTVSAGQAGGGGSTAMSIAVQSTVPQVAADSVNAFAAAYLEYTSAQQLSRLLTSAQQTQAKMDELQNDLDTLSKQLATGLAAIDARHPPVPAETPQAAQARQQLIVAERDQLQGPLDQKRNALLGQQVVLQSTLRDIQVNSEISQAAGRVVTPAQTPTTPVSPKPVRDGITALGLGIVLGLALAFAVEYFDESIKTRDDLERVVGTSLPIIGQIPTISGRQLSRAGVVSFVAPRSAPAEAFRSLRTAVQFLGVERPITTIAVTSASGDEGKSTVVANLAVVLAGAGKTVIMVDCDLRKPSLHTLFGRTGIANRAGITSVMIGEVRLTEAVREVPGIERLWLLPSGPIPPNPSELLSSTAFVDILASLAHDVAVVLIDAPPVLPVTDAAVIAAAADRVLLVVAAGVSTKRRVRRAIERLTQVNAKPAGVVLNRSEPDEATGYYPRVHHGIVATAWSRVRGGSDTPASNGNGARLGEAVGSDSAHQQNG